jgi:hypothetical protein
MGKAILLSVAAIGFFAVSPQTKADSLGVCPKVTHGQVGETETGLPIIMNNINGTGDEIRFSKATFLHPALQIVNCEYFEGNVYLKIPQTYSFNSCTFNNGTREPCTTSREGCVITCNKRKPS